MASSLVRDPKRLAPKLDPAIVADDTKLAAAVDELVRGDPHLDDLDHRIAELALLLYAGVNERTWRTLYLPIDRAVDAHFTAAILLVARWAFQEGRRPLAAERADL